MPAALAARRVALLRPLLYPQAAMRGTHRRTLAKAGRIRFSRIGIGLAGVLAIATMLRLDGLSFGFPALYDPDEPVFILTSLRLLLEHTLNPGWFGHPGTTTIYALTITDLLAFAFGRLTGRFADVPAFAHALYLNPGIVFLPGRLFIVACGVACVGLTFLVAKRLFNERVGLAAAALLAINPLHVKYSQIIRTDVHATVFMLLCVLFSIAIARRGRLRDYLIAAIFVGLACATKWPAATIAVCLMGACVHRSREHPQEARQQIKYLAAAGITSILSLLICSPYILLDYPTVLANLGDEAQAQHLGATGGSFASNIGWYGAQLGASATGAVGLLLALVGIGLAAFRSRIALATIIPASAIFFIVICCQSMVWVRWMVPLLPVVSIFIAVALAAVAGWLTRALGRRSAMIATAAVGAVLAAPMAVALRANAIERDHDTRAMASEWARRHVPPGSTILIEHLAFDLLREPWRLLLPAGRVGCIDAARELNGKVSFSTIGQWRDGRSVIDVGTMDPSTFATCRADFAILSHYDRYKAEEAAFPRELGNYAGVMRGSVLLETFAPKRGEVGGPLIRIFRIGAGSSIAPVGDPRAPATPTRSGTFSPQG